MKLGYVYIMTNQRNGTLYIGVTSDLARRVHEHREGLVEGFTKLYGLTRLVHVEIYDDITVALQREKTMKHWSRRWKIEAIEANNPEWRDLYDDLV